MFINGKEISEKIAEKLKNDFSDFYKKTNKKLSLGVFMVGDDLAIESFVKIKKSFAEKIGVEFKLFKYPSDILESDFLESFLKEQKNVDGVVVQLPLPEHFNTENILEKIDIRKDVDLLSARAWNNFKNVVTISDVETVPPVAGAVWNILQYTKKANQDSWKNKKVLLVGHGKLVGEPVGILLQKYGIDFKILKLNTPAELRKKLLAEAGLIISGAGDPEIIKPDMVKDGVFLVDAGTSSAKKTLVGDIDLKCIEKAKYFSKTPGGVGPITVAVLYENLYKLVNINSK